MAFLLFALVTSALLGLVIVFSACYLAAVADRGTPNDEVIARNQPPTR